MTKTYTKKEAVKHFREWFADLKAENGKADRWMAWNKFLSVNIKEGHLTFDAWEWVCP